MSQSNGVMKRRGRKLSGDLGLNSPQVVDRWGLGGELRTGSTAAGNAERGAHDDLRELGRPALSAGGSRAGGIDGGEAGAGSRCWMGWASGADGADGVKAKVKR